MNTSLRGWLRRVWRIIRWPVWVLLGIVALLIAWRLPAVLEQRKTDQVVAAIHAKRLTLDTVLGTNLPPKPDPILVNATAAGIDVNENGIRDDVELAIFKNYPNSARIRAAQLQYAMALQTELTQVFNTGTLIAAVQESSRATGCIFSTIPKVSLKDTEERIKAALALGDSRTQEVKSLVVNSDLRKSKLEEAFQYLTSHGDLKEEDCDISPERLLN